ncbi:MAG: hypothetical protein MK028_05430, partial [Dehalococcoidia bacterium]|nr:hypothetical protein [Dehalococcoidia bacterium]
MKLINYLIIGLLVTVVGIACGGGDTAPAPDPVATTAPAPTATTAPAPKATAVPMPTKAPVATAVPEPTATPAPTATSVPPTSTPAPTPIPTPYAGPNLGLNTNKEFPIHVPADASAKARLISLGINVPQTGSLEEANHEFMAGLNVDPGYKERWEEHQASVNSVLGAYPNFM